MANKAINIKQSEREVGRDWGAKGAWQQKDVIWQLAFWTLSLWLWFCSPARLPATPTQRQVHWCVRIFYNNFPRVPLPSPPRYFFCLLFFLAFSLCKSMRKVFNCSGVTFWLLWYVFLAHFPQPQFMTKVFRRTHTHPATDRQTKVEPTFALIFYVCVAAFGFSNFAFHLQPAPPPPPSCPCFGSYPWLDRKMKV